MAPPDPLILALARSLARAHARQDIELEAQRRNGKNPDFGASAGTPAKDDDLPKKRKRRKSEADEVVYTAKWIVPGDGT